MANKTQEHGTNNQVPSAFIAGLHHGRPQLAEAYQLDQLLLIISDQISSVKLQAGQGGASFWPRRRKRRTHIADREGQTALLLVTCRLAGGRPAAARRNKLED